MAEATVTEIATVDRTQENASLADSVTGKFRSGAEWRGNANGRPRKGQSVLEQTQKEAERKAKQIAKVAVSRMLRDDSVGNRAWADYRDTFHGVPKTHLVLSQGVDDPLLAMLASVSRETIQPPDQLT